MITQSRLQYLLDYNPDTGVFTRRVRTCNRIRVGEIAGSLNTILGYVEINVGGHRDYGHRLAWLYVNGSWPKDRIDHINGIRNDNRMANLRDVTCAQNAHNRAMPRSNTSGYQGIIWHPQTGKWRARIRADGKSYSLGLYDRPEDAHAAYLSAKATRHPLSPTIREKGDIGGATGATSGA